MAGVRRRPFSRLAFCAALLAGVSVAVATPPTSAASPLSGVLGTLTPPTLTDPQGLGNSGMSGLQYADPAAGVDLVQPPQANNQGDAEVSLPLSIPAGRGGMQPDLTLNYSSYNAEGWVGLGWSLDPGSVDVDTTFGAPRYLPDKESETYTLDGDQLSPTAVRSTLLDRVSDRSDWTRRVETSFERIIRHGSAPGNYWWEVTDQNGTTRLYGARSHYDAASGGYVATRDPSSILADDAGHEFRWALSQVRDISGNTVDYTYTTATGHDVGGDRINAGRELYLSDIRYTGSVAAGNADDPAYEVKLVRDSDLNEPSRRDVVINAKGGFLEVTADLLRHVDVYHRGDLVRRFSLAYTTGAFGKTLLATVSEAGSDGKVWQSHSFDYYDDVRDSSGAYHGFGSAQDWNTGSDNVHENLLTPQSISALGGALSQGGDGRAYLGFNPEDPTKDGSFGGAVVIKGGATEGRAEMIDLNGDGLPDKVFVDDNGLSYRLNESRPGGSTTFGAKGSVADLSKLSHESYIEDAAGPEAYVGLTVQFNVSAHFDIGDSYFTDVNFDGLPDFVDGGTVYFNHLENGTPTFTTSSQGTAVPIDGGSAALPNLPQLHQVEADQTANSPLVDTVRRWIAPWTGTVAVTGDVRLAPPTGASSTDGVRVSVQHNTSELWHDTLTSTGQTVTPSGVDSIAVQRGDALYFRVGSIRDGVQDRVAWAPTVRYTDVSGPADVNRLSQTEFSAAADFTTAGRPSTKVIMPLDGRVSFTATVHKTKATSDEVTVHVFHNDVPVIDKTIPGSFVGDVPVSADFAVAAPANGTQDSVQARLDVDSPVDVTALDWAPDLHYTSATDANGKSVPTTDPATGDPTLGLTVPTDTSIYPETNLAAPQTPWTAPNDEDVTLTPHVTFGPAHKAGQVTLSVKSDDALVAKRTYDVPENGGLPAGNLAAHLAAGKRYWFDLTVRGVDLPASVTGSSVHLGETGTDPGIVLPSARHWADPQGIFPVSYRGWGYAGYNAEGKEDQPLDPDAFVFHQSDYPTSKPTGFNDTGYKDPTQGRSYPYTAAVLNAGTPQAEPVWRGLKDSLYGGAGDAQSSRLASDSVDPVGALGGGERAVPRLSVSVGLNLVAGVGPASGSFGWGPSESLLDYTDVNGDGFPDVVGPNFVRYTGPRGGYVSTGDPSNLDVVGNDTTIAGGGGFDGSALEIKANSKGDANTSEGAPGAITKATRRPTSASAAGQGESADDKETGGKVGVSLGVSTSTSNEPASGKASFDLPQEQELSDVNGDGLPDRIRVQDDTVHVRFNTGYGFTSKEYVWASGARFENGQSVSATAGPTLGFNIGDLEFSGGLSLSESYDAMKTTWADVDGDGVLDKLTRSNGKVMVSFGTGSGLLPAVPFGDMASVDPSNALLGATDLLSGQQVASGHDVGLGAGADFTIGIGPLCIAACYLIVNPGAHYDRSVSSQQVELTDVNGDGLPDSVSSTNDGSMSVRENLTRRTNLLKAVHNPLGGTISVDYTRAGNTVGEPYSRWVMSRVDVDDGRPGDGVNHQVSTYSYDGNRYNPLERQFLGFRVVTQNQIDVTDSDKVLRTYVRTYDNDNVFDSGLQTAETLLDPATGNPVTRTLTDWRLVDLATRTDADLAPTPSDPANVRLLTMAVAPQRVRTTQQWFDATGAMRKSTATDYMYDNLGGVTRTVDHGEPGTTADDVIADVTYSDCTDPGNSWVHLPTTMRVTDANGNLLRERDGSRDMCGNGAVTHLVETTGDGPPAVTDLSFDAWGNYNHIEYPENSNGDRYTVDYGYDADRHTDIASATDSHALTATATYDGAIGQVASRTDANGAVTSYTYDPQGRQASVTMPYEQGTGHHTIDYEYHPDAAGYAYAIARHFDAFHPDDPIETATFTDGIGRQTETKKDATIYQGPGTAALDRMVVSGATEYDALGRAVRRWYPTSEPLGQIGEYNDNTPSVSPTTTTYNLLDLPLVVTHPNGTTTSTAYGYGTRPDLLNGGTLFRTTQTDELGTRHDTWTDVRDNTLADESLPATSDAVLTRYAYDPLGELVRTTDGAGNVATIGYDLLGRTTSSRTPDAGLVTYGYDPASNLVAKVTPNLRANGAQIAYNYDIDRLVSVDYAGGTPDVTYTYGAAGASDNGAGRVIRVRDAARDQSLSYGKDGEVTRERTTMLLHNLNDDTAQRLTFTTSFAMDSFNRYRTVTYPDGEVLTYGYDSGGLVSSATGEKGGISYPYVRRQEYDEFLAKRYQLDGNGVGTETSYDPRTRRVSRIQSISPTREIQDLNYTYDAVGNVTKTDNQLPDPAPEPMGGPSTQTFGYDKYYRLTSAAGSYSFAPNKVRKYTYDVAYSPLGDLLSKDQTDTIYQPSTSPVKQHSTTYTLKSGSIEYTAAPHQITQVGRRTYTWDLDGNFTGWTDDKSGQRRTVTWDAADRQTSVADQGSTTRYAYDDQGRLAIQRGPLGETAFVNQWYTVDNGTVAWKQIWVGTDRVATQRVYDDGTPEDKRYFLQKDLQGDTNLVTDPNGAIYEHFEYFPGGEIWVQEHSDTHHTPYTVAGGYYDETRALLDFGQRWYEPREQFFYQPDPVLTDAPTRAVDDANLLSAYTYAEDNPVRLVDRDGRAPEDVQAAFRAAFGGPDGSIDSAKVNAFTSLALGYLAKQGTTARVGAALGRFLAAPGQSTAKAIKKLTDTLGSKPLVGLKFTKTAEGYRLEEATFSPTFGFKQFTKKFSTTRSNSGAKPVE